MCWRGEDPALRWALGTSLGPFVHALGREGSQGFLSGFGGYRSRRGITIIGGAGDDVILTGSATLADIYALFAT
jgi:hypothetical protein